MKNYDEIREQTHNKLYEWVERVVDAKEKATQEEMKLLPEIAEVLLKYSPPISIL